MRRVHPVAVPSQQCGVGLPRESRDVTYAVFSEGPWDEISAYSDFMGWTMPWYSSSTALDNPALAGGGPVRCYLRDGDDVYLTYETNHQAPKSSTPLSVCST